MNREEFLKAFFMLYGSFTVDKIKIWKNAYEEILVGEIDYERLLRFVQLNWDSTFYPPSPKWLKGAKVDFMVKSDECEALTELRSYKQACNNESDSDRQKSIEISNSLREQLLKKKLAKLART